MAEAVVTVALETIRDVLVEEGKFLFSVRGQVKYLEGAVEKLKSFLKDADARKHDQQWVLACVSEARRLAYRAEDTIEQYAIKVASRRGGGFRKVARRAVGIVGEGIAIHKVGNEIGKLKTEFADLVKSLEEHGIHRIIEAQPSSAKIERQRQLRTTYAQEVDEYFVGMEDDVTKIVTWVTKDDVTKIRRVISICGSGGSGKTTIARKVYNHIKESSRRSFECFAWVSVTQQCQAKMLWQDILNQVLGDKVGDLGEEPLVRKLYNELENKKCFVVLDDIWNMDDWKILCKAFPISKGSSKILLTTRTRDVAKVAHLQHEPKLLEEIYGWDLLTKIAFSLQEDQGNKLQETVEIVGRDILGKCGGLPLAIAALGGILRYKDSLTEWKTVNENFGKNLRENSGTVDVLGLSYDDLPSYLRPCFLYMGCFREDEAIDVMRLYQLWIAEGLIPRSKQGPKETLLEAASNILDELISRNLVQPKVRDVLNDTKSCRLHDMMRELCLAKGKEEQFMEVKSQPNKNGQDGRNLCRQAILVEEEFWWKSGIEISEDDTYLRALMINIYVYKRDLQMRIFNVKGPRSNFKRLRSLILDKCEFKDHKLPREIKDMIHLRFLSLRESLRNVKLPAFIGELQYIQTLDLRDNSYLQLPNIFHKMKRLRCLYLPEYRRRSMFAKRLKFHGLNELEVLEGFNSEDCQCTHLSRLVNLRRFSATICDYEELSTILIQLSSLKVQYISIAFFNTEDSRLEVEKRFPYVKTLLLCPSLHNLYLYAPIGKLPKYEPQFWPDLVSLILRDTKFEEDPMTFLQELPNLRELTYWNAYDGEKMHCGSKAFPKLTSLKLQRLRKIKEWRVDAGAFPNLETLVIWDCYSFEIEPHGLTPITTLTQIDIWRMPGEFRSKYGRLPNTNH